MKKIKASIAQTGLHYVTDFFNQNLTTVLGELLQNSRRAGATAVKVTTAPAGDKRTKVVIEDNGSGIQEPEKLLTLWDSGWDAETTVNESPAGFGFFSLAHLPDGVTVRSLDWQMHIDQHVFKGAGEATCMPKSPVLNGTTLTFYVEDAYVMNLAHLGSRFTSALREAVKFYPVPVTLDGKPLEQEDFLKDATWRRAFEGVTVGIYTKNPDTCYITPRHGINFYGVTLSRSVASPQPDWYVRLDVTGACALDLVKPARNSVVENQKWQDMQALVRRAVYEVCRTEPHNLPYDNWKEAESMGLKLPEARALLAVDMPHDIGDGENWSGGLSESYEVVGYARQPCTSDSLISALSDEDLVALHLSGAKLPLLFRHSPTYRGYSWYPRRTVESVVQVVKKGGKTYKLTTDSRDWSQAAVKALQKGRGFVDSVTLKCQVNEPGEKSSFLEYPSSLAFGTDSWGGASMADHFVCTKEGFASIDADTLKAIFFYYSDDSSDGRDNQESDFYEEAAIELARRRGGDDAAHKLEIEQSVDRWRMVSAMQKMKVRQITLRLNDSVGLVVELPPNGSNKKPAKPARR